MPFSSSPSLRAAKHHDRGLTLVFGSDGQVSLLGAVPSQPPAIPPTFLATNTGVLTPGTHPLPTRSPSVSPVPNLEATSSLSLTSTSASLSSSPSSSSYDPSSATTNTDTNLPSIPTIDYPTPSPTAVSAPKDHGVGAPFYLAMVLASISFIGCVAAFIAWWIRSSSRRHHLELEDPWVHSDSGSTHVDNANDPEKGERTRVETQTRPYYLPASIVRRSSSNILAVPHTIPHVEDGSSQNAFSRTTPGAGPLVRSNDPRSQNLNSRTGSYRNGVSSRVADFNRARPGAERLQTGLSVQESTRTLGKLRVANRVPGDITSGDEGGKNLSRMQNSAGVPPSANHGGLTPADAGENVAHVDRSSRTVQEGDALWGPPGPATTPWGKRIDTVAALRRTRHRAPEMGAHDETLNETPDGQPGGTMSQAPPGVKQEENERVLARPPVEPLGWTGTLKSSFWQAVDAVTRSRSADSESRAANPGGGSKFTPAPRRVASRRSPVSPTRSATGFAVLGAQFQEMGTKYEPILPAHSIDKSLQNTTYTGFRGPKDPDLSASRADKGALVRVDSLPPRVSRLGRDLGANTRRQHSNPSRTDTGSAYSTDSAAARANLRKYGYADSIPSTWSALGASRESQLDLSRTFLPLPRPLLSFSPGPLSIAPSRLTSGERSIKSGSTSVSTRTTARSESDIIGSDTGTLRSGKSANTVSYGGVTATSSMRSMSRGDTVQSRSTIDHGTGFLQPSTNSSMLSRKKGVTRRKRPRPPPRAPSTASSVQSVESGLSVRELAVRRALLERRKKVKAAESFKDHEDVLMGSS